MQTCAKINKKSKKEEIIMADKELITPVTPDEVDDIRVTLNTDDGDIECRPLTIFEVDGEDYIALMPLDENDQDNAEGIVYFYGYSEDEQGLAQLRYIDSEDEYEAVLDRFDELQDEAFYDSMED